jgi:hypothetical protein
MQIRSADEPESRFYRCLKCEFTWREEWTDWWSSSPSLCLCQFWKFLLLQPS